MHLNHVFNQNQVLVLAMGVVLGWASESYAVRYAPARIFVDGKEILFCGGSDDGRLSSREVFNTLKTRQFHGGKDFNTLQFPKEAKEFVLKPPSNDPHGVVIDVNTGGKFKMASLRIIRVPKDNWNGEWIIDPKVIREIEDKRFNWRVERPIDTIKSANQTAIDQIKKMARSITRVPEKRNPSNENSVSGR